MRLLSKSILLTLSALVSCIGSGRAQSPAVSKGMYEIAGVVLNTRTGLPVRDAEVTLRRTKDNERLAETATNAEGHFSFPQLSSDKYSLLASHRGYIPAAYDEHENGSTAIVTGAGLTSTGLRFMLAPQAVLFGAITDDSGDPVPNAMVSLYRLDTRVGAGKMARSRSAGADELGSYEIANLPPGNYFLAVTATPWYAIHSSSLNGAQAKIADTQPRSLLDVAYPATYYPDVADSSFAASIAVGAGERVPINVTLHPVPAIHVFLQLPPSGPNGQFSAPQLSHEVFGYPDFVPATIANSLNSSGLTTVEISGIAPGAYEMELNGSNGESNRATSVDLNSDRAIDVSSAIPLVDLSGKITMAGGENPPSSLYVILTPQQSQNAITMPVGPDGSFHIRALRAGSFEFAIGSAGYPMTTGQLTATGAALKGHLLTIGSEPVTLTAVVSETSATVNGVARLDGIPASGVFLEMIPKNPATGRAAFAVNQSDSDGSFNFLHILPGEYTLVAIQEGWMLDWTNPDAMAAYLARGLKVLVPPNSQEIDLRDSVAVQPR